MRIVTSLSVVLVLCFSAFGQARRAQPTSPQTQQTPATQSKAAETTEQAPKQPETKATTLTPEEVLLFLEIQNEQTQAELNTLVPTVDKDKATANSKLAALYAKAAKSPALSQVLAGMALDKYESAREEAKGAVQVSQAADEAGIKFQLIIMGQNQRIIELLEQLVKKK